MKFSLCILLVLVSYCFQPSQATYGLDISYYDGELSDSDWDCLHQSGFDFAVVEVQDGVHTNPYAGTNVQRARQSGFSDVDIYAFFCVSCGGSGEEQVSYLLRLPLTVEGAKGIE